MTTKKKVEVVNLYWECAVEWDGGECVKGSFIKFLRKHP